MIDFALPPELELLRDTARQLAQQELRPHERESERARAVPRALEQRFRETGLARIELPEALGGAELGALARVLVLEELAAGDPGAALALDPLGPALYPLLELGGPDALERFAAPLLETPGARAVLVWNGAESIEIREGRAHGRVAYVPSERADLVVLLEAGAAHVVSTGIELAPLRGAGLRAAGAAELRLVDAPLDASWREPRAAARALARACLYLAGLLLGAQRAAAELSREYALERVAFGRPIAHHQALAFLIADMAAAVEGTRLLLWEAAHALDTGEEADERCASAFLEAAEQALFVTPNAVQILGGHGFMQDYPVEKWMREGRTLGLLLGGVDAAREDAGRELAGREPPVWLSPECGL